MVIIPSFRKPNKFRIAIQTVTRYSLYAPEVSVIQMLCYLFFLLIHNIGEKVNFIT